MENLPYYTDNPTFKLFISGKNEGLSYMAQNYFLSIQGKFPVFFMKIRDVIQNEQDLKDLLQVHNLQTFENTVNRMNQKNLMPIIVIDDFEKAQAALTKIKETR
ncbi:hypothetical protein PPERSA_06416 [Pseudocohnilembus persalinus]|uniref:Uncharacterized protein n=1 Tax=Pseudocohnilembus persalinus TaxID=266149 RepID=A0A0V0QR54_PSEPJ|nr:hypothetical protein PPERSA_06416 [Pseudocohnilembus persalinus]|eukprot:KRX04782.1 hypothetical protein PPERSA_06416 [Pseudocohnilembus persalinus]